MADNEYLKAAVHGVGRERADPAGTGKVHAEQVGYEINLSCVWIHCEGACTLARRQILNHGVGVGNVLANDGEVAIRTAVGGKDQAVLGVVPNGIHVRADGQRGDQVAIVGIEDQ